MSPSPTNQLAGVTTTIETTSSIDDRRPTAFWQSEYDRVVVRSEGRISVFTAVQVSDLGKLTKLLKKKLAIPDRKGITLTFVCEGDKDGRPRMAVTLQY